MKKRNGFTLIELLAVIVILAVIALIATPFVTGAIDKAKKGAAQDSGYGIAKAAETFYALNGVDNEYVLPVTFTYTDKVETSKDSTTGTPLTTAKLDLKGTKPTSGSVTISATGDVTFTDLVINGYTVSITTDGVVSAE